MFTLAEIQQATHGKIFTQDKDLRVSGVSTNSKTLKAGELFIAIKGERLDGHKFIPQAIKAGAAAILLSDRKAATRIKKVPVIIVEDTVKALGWLAAFHRERFSIPVIAITGSAGKTTTKNLMAAVLETRYQVLFNSGTENNHIGVPFTLLKLTKEHDIAVVELGTNHPGEIAWLTSLVKPTVAVLLNIGESHLEGLKSLKDVFKEKSTILRGLGVRGQVVFNNDDRFLKTLKVKAKRYRLTTFSLDANSDMKAGNATPTSSGLGLKFTVNSDHPFEIESPVYENIYNALAAISCGRLFNISYNTIAVALKSYRFLSNRQSVKKVNRSWLINDTYNANPVSMHSAIRTLARFSPGKRKILVAADMLELGPQTKKLHEQAGRWCAEERLDFVLTLGSRAKWLAQEAKQRSTDIHVFHCNSRKALHTKLRTIVQPQDVILVKGSRGMRMEETVNFLENLLNQEENPKIGARVKLMS